MTSNHPAPVVSLSTAPTLPASAPWPANVAASDLLLIAAAVVRLGVFPDDAQRLAAKAFAGSGASEARFRAALASVCRFPPGDIEAAVDRVWKSAPAWPAIPDIRAQRPVDMHDNAEPGHHVRSAR